MKGSLQRLETKPFPLEREWTVEGVPVLRLSGTLSQPVGKPSRVPRRVQRFYQHQARCYLRYCQRFLLPLAEEAHRAALAATSNGRIGMIATQASVRSGAYERTLRALDPAVTVIQKACPLFVPLAEEGRTRPGDIVIETVAEEYLASLRQEGIDTLILGCTHYPLLKDVIANVMGPGVALIDSGEESAKELQRLLTASDSLGEPQGGGAIYCVSDRVEDFQRLASRFLGEDVAGAARRVEVEDV